MIKMMIEIKTDDEFVNDKETKEREREMTSTCFLFFSHSIPCLSPSSSSSSLMSNHFIIPMCMLLNSN